MLPFGRAQRQVKLSLLEYCLFLGLHKPYYSPRLAHAHAPLMPMRGIFSGCVACADVCFASPPARPPLMFVWQSQVGLSRYLDWDGIANPALGSVPDSTEEDEMSVPSVVTQVLPPATAVI